MIDKISKPPWDEMKRPESEQNLSIKGVAGCPGVDWVVGFDGSFGIGFDVSDINKPSVDHNYKKIKFTESIVTPKRKYFSFLCDDDVLRELFEQLVLDLLNFCVENIELKKYPQAIVNRARAWEDLFSKQRGGLTKLQAIGLMAELNFLENQWLKNGHSLETWKGPSGAAQDFSDGDKIIEIKVRTPSNSVSVNSLEQLNRDLGMYVVTYQACVDDQGETVNDCVFRISKLLGSNSSVFMDYVTKVGFVKEKNFNSPIIVENGEAYLVDNNMPAIQVGDVIGLISAKYSIDLKVCASEKLTLEEFHDRLYS